MYTDCLVYEIELKRPFLPLFSDLHERREPALPPQGMRMAPYCYKAETCGGFKVKGFTEAVNLEYLS